MIRFFDHIKKETERAAQRKGQKARDHPPPDKKVNEFMMKSLVMQMKQSSMAAHDELSMLRCSQFPAPYVPSTRSVNDLQPLMISDMTLETHHRGKKVFIRALTPADRITAITAIVEDEEGTAVILQLYNQPEEDQVGKDSMLEHHDIFVIKEPYFKVTTDGQYSLRVDHVSDIVRLENDDECIPRRWRQSPKYNQADSPNLRSTGNSAVQEKKWDVAERL